MLGRLAGHSDPMVHIRTALADPEKIAHVPKKPDANFAGLRLD
jgi:hypothetical protein